MFNRRIFTGRLLCTSLAISATLGLAPLAAHAQAKLKVAGIYTVPYEQQWVSRIHKALKAAEARGEIEYKSSENVANADYERVMREYANGGNQLIFGEVFGVESAARKVAKDFPKTAFLMGSSGKPQAPNFSVFDNYIQEPAYLTCMIAGGMTKTNKIVMVGGFPIPEVNRLMQAFMAGAKEVNPKVEFTVTFINSWFDPPKAPESAVAQIDGGCDILFGERIGTADGAKARGKLAVGSLLDYTPRYPGTVFANAVWYFGPTLDAALADAVAGRPAGKDYGGFSMMKQAGNDVLFDKQLVPPAAVEQMMARRAAIRAGSFTVPTNDAKPA